jgi:hypothetical protein
MLNPVPDVRPAAVLSGAGQVHVAILDGDALADNDVPGMPTTFLSSPARGALRPARLPRQR